MVVSEALLPLLLLAIHSHAQSLVFGPQWLPEQVEKDIQQQTQSMTSKHETNISTDNGGVTTVAAMIGGKTYMATFPQGSSITVSSTTEVIDGKSAQVFTITVNNVTYTYKTVDGHTTVINGKGETLTDGGPFRVFSR